MSKHDNEGSIWPQSGLPLLIVRDDGFLTVTDDFIKRYITGPQMELVPESCAVERDVHAALLEDPWRDVSPEQIRQMQDPDAQENYQVMLAYRDRLADAGTIEGSYLSAFTQQQVQVPAIFVNHMTQVIIEQLLGDTGDPFMARAAETFFREQIVSIHDGAILAADVKTAAILRQHDVDKGKLGKTLMESGIALRSSQLDVLNPDNADLYWDRSEKHNFVLDLTFGRPGLEAMCRVMELWMKHLLMTPVQISPLQEINDENWVWHTGLDVESTALLNDLYEDREIEDTRMEGLISLFKLEFRDVSVMRDDVAGRPIYLALAMDQNRHLRLKPQNLLFNMPLASSATLQRLH